ncbi:MAG: ATP-dependent protease ATPase subunit HslU [Candidatus Hydrogenedentes bacterium]|nr:ATP-dependent protease ATPase subunit HslU [Candidatus Hydrogenedentota bacterium]
MHMKEYTPKAIVQELDKYIIGQDKAKRKVAIALRNRWRRLQLPESMRDEVIPKNIIMIGSTGVGKTEIARRLSKMADAPFVKVEASKFTEVGYVGRDCESMVRELTEAAVKMAREELREDCEEKATHIAEHHLLDLLLPTRRSVEQRVDFNPMDPRAGDEPPVEPGAAAEEKARRLVAKKLAAGELDDQEVELTVSESNKNAMLQVFAASGMEEMGLNLQDMLGQMSPKRRKNKKVTVAEAREILLQEAFNEMIDMDLAARRAIDRVENSGIIFLDEIDKIAGRGGYSGHGPDVSREGVQRDILPIVEGSTVITKYGSVRTDHILFIAAGAFHNAKISDLIPELQGRFPIRVELDSLKREDFERILTQTECSLIKQYQMMLATEGVSLVFEAETVEKIAEICERVNAESEDIGARRLHTILEYLLEDIAFSASERSGETIAITPTFVETQLENIVEQQNLNQYIL